MQQSLAGGLAIDHVIVAVRDLDAAGRTFEGRYGLASIEGGRHPRWGTANRIVPLGDAYLELVAVVDPSVALRDPFGRRVAYASTDAGALAGWAARTDHLDAVAARLSLHVESGSRARPDGSELRWRYAGIEQAVQEPSLPFFIEWEPGAALPGQVRRPVGRVDELVLFGSAKGLSAWLGPHALPVTVVPGAPAVRSVRVTVGDGPTVVVGD